MTSWQAPPPRIPGLPDRLVEVPTWTQENPDRGPWWAWHAEVKRFREGLAAALKADPTLWRDEIDRCRRFGPKYAITAHLHVYEPRTDSRFGQGYLPFVLQPFQVKALDFLETPATERRTKVIKKPREVGITTACLGRSLHKWAFSEVWDQIYISATEDDADQKSNKDSILVKLDMMIAGCPGPLLPRPCRNFNPWAPRYPPWRKHLSILNPETGATVNGHATTLQAVRGGRRTEIDLDEAAFWEVPMGDVLASVMGATHNVVVMSSASEEVSKEFTALVAATERDHPDSLLVIEDWEHPLWTAEQDAADRRRYQGIGEHGGAAFERERKGLAATGVHRYKYPEAEDVPIVDDAIDVLRPTYVWHDPGRAGEGDGDYAIILAQLREYGLLLCYGWKANQFHGASYGSTQIAPLLIGQVPDGPGYRWTQRDIAFAGVMARLQTVMHFGDPFGSQKGSTDGWYDDLNKEIRRLTGGKRSLVVQTRLLFPELLPKGMRDVRSLPTREDAAKRWLKKTRCADNPCATEVLRAIRALTLQRTKRDRPRIEEPSHTYHESDPSHFSQAYEFGVVHLEWRETDPALRDDQPARTRRLYADPYGGRQKAGEVGTVPTVPIVRR